MIKLNYFNDVLPSLDQSNESILYKQSNFSTFYHKKISSINKVNEIFHSNNQFNLVSILSPDINLKPKKSFPFSTLFGSPKTFINSSTLFNFNSSLHTPIRLDNSNFKY